MKGKEGTGDPGGPDAKSGRYSSKSGLCPSGENCFFADVETSFLLKQDLLPCPIPRRRLAGPNLRTKGQLIVTFSSPISKVSITTLDLRIVKLLLVGFRFSLIGGNRCFVRGYNPYTYYGY